MSRLAACSQLSAGDGPSASVQIPGQVLCTDPDRTGQHRQFTGGPGGTGKSRMSEALRWVFSARGQAHLLQITGTSGSVAAQIGGTNLHSACGLDPYRASARRKPRMQSCLLVHASTSDPGVKPSPRPRLADACRQCRLHPANSSFPSLRRLFRAI